MSARIKEDYGLKPDQTGWEAPRVLRGGGKERRLRALQKGEEVEWGQRGEGGTSSKRGQLEGHNQKKSD